MTETNDKIKLSGEEAKKALNYMELIVSSLMLRNGLMLSRDGRRIVFKGMQMSLKTQKIIIKVDKYKKDFIYLFEIIHKNLIFIRAI